MLPRQLKSLLRDANIPEQDCSNTLALRAASQVNTYLRVMNMKLNDMSHDQHREDVAVNQLLLRLHQLEALAQADAHC